MKRGFTLVELLVVVAIVACLAAILLPVFAKARERARKTDCIAHTYQVCRAVDMFRDDHDGFWPIGKDDREAEQMLQPYMPGKIRFAHNSPNDYFNYVLWWETFTVEIPDSDTHRTEVWYRLNGFGLVDAHHKVHPKEKPVGYQYDTRRQHWEPFGLNPVGPQ